MNYSENEINVAGYKMRSYSCGRGEKTIVFLHGASCDSGMWEQQLSASSLQCYNMVAIDLPGHGRSDWRLSYSLRRIGAELPGIISQVVTGEYIITAFSYATCLVGEAAPLLHGCKGLFLSGANLLGGVVGPKHIFKPVPESYVMASGQAAIEDIRAFGADMVANKSSAIIDAYVRSYANTDPAFREDIRKIIEASDWSDEITNVTQSAIPIAIVYGKQEELVNTDYLDGMPGKWGDKTWLIDKASHMVNAEQPHAFNELLLSFANACFGV